jgi:hypothetical protein
MQICVINVDGNSSKAWPGASGRAVGWVRRGIGTEDAMSPQENAQTYENEEYRPSLTSAARDLPWKSSEEVIALAAGSWTRPPADAFRRQLSALTGFFDLVVLRTEAMAG